MNTNQRFLLVAILLLGLGLRFSISNKAYLRPWDERYHALVAKDIWHAPLKPMLYKDPVLDYDYRFWNRNHVWLHKPPLTLWVIGTSTALFGNHALAVRIPSLVFSLASILLVFLIGRQFFTTSAALFAALIFSIFSKGIALSTGMDPTDHVDTLFAFLVLLGTYLGVVWRNDPTWKRSLLLGLILGATYLCKSLPAMILIPIWAALLWEKSGINLRNAGALFTGAILLALPWAIYTKSHFPLEAAYESDYNWRHLTEVIEGHGGDWSYYLGKISEWLGVLFFVNLLMLILISVKTKFKKFLWLILWILIPLLIFSLSTTKMEGYVFVSAPAYSLLFGFVLSEIQNRIEKRKNLIVTAVACVLLIQPVRSVVGLWERFQAEDYSVYWPEEIMQFTDGENFILFNDEDYIQTMFFFDGIAYKNLPTKKHLDIAKGQNVPVFIRRHEGMELDSLKGAVWID